MPHHHPIENKHQLDLEVSEHAILRYLERVEGVDIKKIIKKMIPEDVLEIMNIAKGIRGNGTSSVFACGTHTIILQNGVIVTVLKPEMHQIPPDDEFVHWNTKALLREIPWEGTYLSSVVENEVNRRVNDKGWERRQDTQAMKTARALVAEMQKRLDEMEHQLFKQKNESKKEKREMQQQHYVECRNAKKICAVVRNLIGRKKWRELKEEAGIEEAGIEGIEEAEID